MRSTSLTVAVVCFALVLPTVVTLAYFVWLKDAPTAVQQAAYTIGKVVQFGLPAVWVLLVERRRPCLRLPSARDFRWGALSGLAIVLPALGLYFAGLKAALPVSAIEAMRGKISGLGVGGVPEYLVLAVFYSIVHSLLEEYYWRWFVFGQLVTVHGLGTGSFFPRPLALVGWNAKRHKAWFGKNVPVPVIQAVNGYDQLQRHLAGSVATIVSALGFAAHHVVVLALYFGWDSPLTYLFSAAVAVGGTLWAGMYHRTGSLWGPWLSHLLVDAGIFFVGYDLVVKGV